MGASLRKDPAPSALPCADGIVAVHHDTSCFEELIDCLSQSFRDDSDPTLPYNWIAEPCSDVSERRKLIECTVRAQVLESIVWNSCHCFAALENGLIMSACVVQQPSQSSFIVPEKQSSSCGDFIRTFLNWQVFLASLPFEARSRFDAFINANWGKQPRAFINSTLGKQHQEPLRPQLGWRIQCFGSRSDLDNDASQRLLAHITQLADADRVGVLADAHGDRLKTFYLNDGFRVEDEISIANGPSSTVHFCKAPKLL
jgi:hypothetical protein